MEGSRPLSNPPPGHVIIWLAMPPLQFKSSRAMVSGETFPSLRWLWALAVLLPAWVHADAARLFVCYPTLARPPAIQKMLQEHCRGFQVTVFGRLEDFQAMVAEKTPEAVLALPEVIEDVPGYSIRLQGMLHGSDKDSCVLVSLESSQPPSKDDAFVIGMVGTMDRVKEERVVRKLIPGNPRIRRATKVEDLLPLLLFHSVNGVIVDHKTLGEFRKRSEAKLAISLPGRFTTGLVGLAVLDGQQEKQFVTAVRGLDEKELEMLGIDRWK